MEVVARLNTYRKLLRREKGKASFKSLIADDTQLAAEYGPKDDILYQRSCKLDKLNNSKLVARKRDADIANERKQRNGKNVHAVLIN